MSPKKTAKIIPAFADPIKFCRMFWPEYTIYGRQREILYSLKDNYETIVPAAHELGKDFIAGIGILWFFISRRPARVLTTSPNSSQLEDVLWGEIRRFIQEAAAPLPIQIMDGAMKMYQLNNHGGRIPRSEVVGRVYEKPDSMMGRHVERGPDGEPTCLLVVDEGSGCDNEGYKRADSWTHRKLVIGNPYPCTNFFYLGTMGGDKEPAIQTTNHKLRRRVIHIRAEDSPNVRLGLTQKSMGMQPTNEELIPGVLTYADYVERRASWDPIQQCIGLDGKFYEGAEVKLYPPEWIANSIRLYEELDVRKRRAKAIGIDPAEGGDSTCFAAVDEWGLIDLISKKTPDTSVIGRETLAFMRKHGMDPANLEDCRRVCFDRGGGGKQHADYLRNQGYNVRTEAFGSSPTEEVKLPGHVPIQERREDKEQRYAYKNKRAEMAGRLSIRMDPAETVSFSFASGKHKDDPLTKLAYQLSMIPKKYDGEGKLRLPSKRKNKEGSKEETLTDLIGYSPDEMDAVMLAVYAMEVESTEPVAGVLV